MMAAISAARCKKNVLLIERNPSLGRKLSITGKGRCNVTNDCGIEELFENVPRNPKFLYSSFYTFSNYSTKEFFESLGVPLKVERGKRVFPASDRAGDIVNAMKRELERLGCEIVHDRAREIVIKDGCVRAVRCDGGTYDCTSALIATGGASYPKTGSTGDGYKMARKAGHSVTELSPSLSALIAHKVAHLQGLALKNISVTVLDGKGKKLYTDFGEMLFTHFGVSGPVILSASGHMRMAHDCTLLLDLKPALTDEQLDARIRRDFEGYQNRDLVNALSKLLPLRIIGAVIEKSGVDGRKKVNSVTREERTRLLRAIKNFDIKIEGFRPIDEAIVTSGGVDVKEIDPSTMESKIVKGLYFAGEVIDVDAYTGGFNLQIAFSTGYLAGMNM